MKQRNRMATVWLLLCTLMAAPVLNVSSQSFPGGFEHVLKVKRYSDWGKGYLTITDDGRAKVQGEMVNFTYEQLDTTLGPFPGHLILEVDGISAEGWTPSEFYKVVDGRKDLIRLKIRGRDTRRGIYDYETLIRPRYELPDNYLSCLVRFGEQVAHTDFMGHDGEPPVKIVEHKEYEFDWFPVIYYDFALGNDPLREKKILESMKVHNYFFEILMTRREENPDIVFTIAKDTKESIERTYIPPSSRTVYTGSTSRPEYGILTGRFMGWKTTTHSYTTSTPGYTHETKTADTYLEICALDAKRINDSRQTFPPIVYQATAMGHMNDNEYILGDLNNWLIAYASWMSLPPEKKVRVGSKVLHAELGVECNASGNDLHTISYVKPRSIAEMINLKVGDKLLKATFMKGNHSHDEKKHLKKRVKESGWHAFGGPLSDSYEFVILRDGEKITKRFLPFSLTFHRYYFD